MALPAALQILIEMAEGFFSSSWRILEPYGCAVPIQDSDEQGCVQAQ
jgi:hypothetical protein